MPYRWKAVEFFQYTGNDVSNDADTGSLILKEYFPDGTGMSEWMTRSGTSMEDAFVETYTLNKDGTITIPAQSAGFYHI